jgi:hypothetical protein
MGKFYSFESGFNAHERNITLYFLTDLSYWPLPMPVSGYIKEYRQLCGRHFNRFHFGFAIKNRLV